jgi:hypothetical protein
MEAIDLHMTRSFLNRLAPNEDVTFQTFADNKATTGWLAKALHGTLNQHADELSSLNQRGAGVFVMANRGDGIVHAGNKTCRTNSNVRSIRALFADADGVPLEPILKIAPPPHIIVESSPGKWHIYWLTHDTPMEEFSDRQMTIAKLFGTDPAVKDLARVMRLPGFLHQKGAPFLTRLVLPE